MGGARVYAGIMSIEIKEIWEAAIEEKRVQEINTKVEKIEGGKESVIFLGIHVNLD